MTLWFLVVYAPLAHMVWGKGGFLNAALGGRFPCLDFAGGTVVHISSGVSALVCALYLGKRIGYPKQADAAAQPGAELYRRMPACGWAGLDSTRAARWRRIGLASSAFVATHFASGGGGDRLERRGMDQKRTSERTGRDLRSGRGAGGDYAGGGICGADAGAGRSDLSRAFSAT